MIHAAHITEVSHRPFFLKFLFLAPNENRGIIGRNKLTEENDIVIESFVG